MAPPYLRNTIALKTQGWHEEMNCDVICSPGHLLKMTTTGGVKPHDSVGGLTEMMFAKENALAGQSLFDNYVVNDPVFVIRALPGDHILAILPANCPIVTEGNPLMSNGDGSLINSVTVVEELYSSVAASAAVSNTTVETAFTPTYTVPANTFLAGDELVIHGEGIATATNSTDTLAIKVKLGSTVLLTLPALDVATNDTFQFDVHVVLRTIGASGTLVADCTYVFGTPGTATERGQFLGSTAVDTTATQAITVTATWSVANSGNSCRLDVLTIKNTRMTAPTKNVAVALETVDNSAGSSIARIAVRVL